MHKFFLTSSALLCGLAIALGALGAHKLQEVAGARELSIFDTGVRYHFYHGIALMLTGILHERFRNKWTVYAGYGFLIGIILFSGSLYLLTYLKLSGTVGLGGLGLVTPLGGLFFIAGWIFLMMAFSIRSSGSLKSI